jgi:2-desacetyl-2-hydroxyethyl bacteriochlorophyllide A dehydrogenase
MKTTYPMAWVVAPGRIEFQERTLPPLGNKDVLIQVKAAAICGSDLHLFKGRHPSVELPAAIGHETAGQIIEIGKEVTEHKVGERVTIEPVITCGECEFCKRGQYHLCVRISFQYRKGQGAFTPYFIAPEDRVYTLPDCVNYEEGALVEPLSVALHAQQKSGLQRGQTCAVFGAGALGVLIAALNRRAGASRVFVSDINPFRLEKAMELGATDVINSLTSNPLEVIQTMTNQMGVDCTFEAVGLGTTLLQAITAVKKGGMVTMVGIFENPEVILPANLIVQREIRLSGSQAYCGDFEASLALLEKGEIDLMKLITYRFALDDIQKGFDLLSGPPSDALKVIITMGE